MSSETISNGKSGMKLPVGRILYVFDVLVWMTAILFAAILRYEFAMGQINWNAYVGFVVGAAVLQLGAGLVFRLYRKGMRFRVVLQSHLGGVGAGAVVTLSGPVLVSSAPP